MNFSKVPVQEIKYIVIKQVSYLFSPCSDPNLKTESFVYYYQIILTQMNLLFCNQLHSLANAQWFKNKFNRNVQSGFNLSVKNISVLWLLHYAIGFKNSRHFFIQSQVKPEPVETHSRMFSRALCQLHVITTSFDWLTVIFMAFVIGYSNYFGFGVTTLNWKPLYQQLNYHKLPLINLKQRSKK